MKSVSVVMGLVFGFFSWGFVTLISNGTPIGKVGGVEKLIFFSPVVGVLTPLIMFALHQKRHALAAWIFAVAPIVGVANVILLIIFAIKSGLDPVGWSAPVVVLTSIWMVPGLFVLAWGALQFSRRGIA